MVKGGGWIGEFQNGTISWLNQGDGTFTGTVIPKAVTARRRAPSRAAARARCRLR